MERAAAMAWLVATSAACGTSSKVDPRDITATSGSRLVAERWTTSDGVGEFAGWYDSELDTRCRWLMASDGRWRCLPSEAVGGYYASSSCTEPAFAASTACSPVGYVTYGGEVFHAGPRLGEAYAKGGEAPCTRIPSDADAPQYLGRGERIPIDRFVAADLYPWGDAISVEEWRGEDGSREGVTLHAAQRPVHTAMGYVCELRMAGLQSAACVATESWARAYQPHFLDASCTQRVIEPQSFSPKINIDYFVDPCGDRPFYSVGPLDSVATVYYRNENGECASVVSTPNVFEVTEIANANVALTLVVDDATTRLRHTTWHAASGEQWAGPLFDSERGTLCEPQPDAVDQAHCAPTLNDTFDPSLWASTTSACDPMVGISAACWGQTMRTTPRRYGACGYDLVQLRAAIGPLVTETRYIGLGPQALWHECAAVDTTGLELREGDYSDVDGTGLPAMKLVRDR